MIMKLSINHPRDTLINLASNGVVSHAAPAHLARAAAGVCFKVAMWVREAPSAVGPCYKAEHTFQRASNEHHV